VGMALPQARNAICRVSSVVAPLGAAECAGPLDADNCSSHHSRVCRSSRPERSPFSSQTSRARPVLLNELGDRYADVLAEHRRVIREAVERHDGIEVDTQGDAFFVAFARVSDGVAAAADAQAALSPGAVRVRMGLHTGEPKITDERYVGIDVHRAARIAGAANGGQVVISPTTRELLDDEIEVRDLGEHRLKDFPAATRLLAVILNNRGNVALEAFDLESARPHLQEAIEIQRSHGFRGDLANSLADLGFVALAEGRDADASRCFGECLTLSVELGLRDILVWALIGTAAMGLIRERFSAAATLLGAAIARQEALGVGGYYPIGEKYKEEVATAGRESLGHAVYEAAVSAGRALSQEEAVQLARSMAGVDD
jgi:tetratricopeptide (TPR) repeat protein